MIEVYLATINNSSYLAEAIAVRLDQFSHLFLRTANEVWGKVMFLHLCVILFTGGRGSAPACPSVGTDPGGWADPPRAGSSKDADPLGCLLLDARVGQTPLCRPPG